MCITASFRLGLFLAGLFALAVQGAEAPAPPISNAMLLGAILEGAEGNVFIKLTGPASVVRPCKDALRKMTEGALKAE